MINFHVISLLCPCFISVVMAVLLFFSEDYRNELPKKVLAWFMIIILVLSVTIVIYQSHLYSVYRYLDGFYMSGMLLLHPVFYLYIRTLILNRFKFSFIWHFLPAILNFIAACVLYLLLTKSEAETYLSTYILGKASGSIIINYLYKLLIVNKFIHVVQAVVYFILAFRLLRIHQKNIVQFFSSTGKYYLGWLFSFNIIYFTMSLAGILVNLIPTKTVYTNTIYVDLTMLMFGIFAFYTGIKGLEQKSVGSIINSHDKVAVKFELKSISEKSILEKINKYIIHEKAYLVPELKVWDIVEKTGINRSYISQAINNYYKTSFCHYINKHRTEEACRLLEERSNKNIENIAFESGFNSVSTFNRAFKKFKGVLPSEYRYKNSGI